jgi:hypothetical protein
MPRSVRKFKKGKEERLSRQSHRHEVQCTQAGQGRAGRQG